MLNGEIRSTAPLNEKYRIIKEDNHYAEDENGVFYRNSKVNRIITNKETLPNLKTILFCGEKSLKITVKNLYERFENLRENLEIDLLENEILDSLAFIELITTLNDEFDIEIQPTQVELNTWRSVERIVELVENEK